MIIPYATDAPIYHFPRATLGLIAVNTAIHVGWSLSSPGVAEPYALKLGAGLHPLTWLTHNFLHADFLHLLFNMIFLWSYGIIVEGKIGWLSYLACYLGLGTVHGAVIQAAYLHAAEPTYVLGASAIIFGLMAMSMLWAPVNELSCFFLLIVGFRIISNTFEWPIYAFALLQMGLEGLSVTSQYLLHGDPMSSGLLHVSGAFWGLVIGSLMLRFGWVDCEGWDVFSLLKKRRALNEAWKERGERIRRSHANERLPRSMRSEEDRPGLSAEERIARQLAKVHRAIGAGDMDSMLSAYRKWLKLVPSPPGRDELRGLIKALHARNEYVASVPVMRALCRFHPEGCERIQLRLGGLLLHDLERPTEARRLLEQIAPDHLDAKGRVVRQKLLESADRMIAEGVLEVEEEI